MNNIEELKRVEYDLLKKFVSVCDDNNLKYFLLGGTLLGAVRHKGFIPWDDDIDVGMPRKDYEKFIKIAPSQLPEYIFLQTNETDSEYPQNFAKLRNCNTTFIESSVKNLKINHGIYIDIFPLDAFPNNKLRQKIILFKSKLLSLRISELYTIKKTNNIKNTRNKLIVNLMKIFYPSPYDAVKAKEKLNRNYENVKTDYLVNFSGAWGEREISLSKWFDETVKLQFENDMFCCPKNYDEYLKQIYGDYLQLPPPEQRVTHHYSEVVDPFHSYIDYLK